MTSVAQTAKAQSQSALIPQVNSAVTVTTAIHSSSGTKGQSLPTPVVFMTMSMTGITATVVTSVT